MTSSQAWSRIKEIAGERRDESARTLAGIATRARDAQQQLELLLGYRLDYRARFDTAVRAGIRGEALRNFQGFLANLEQAIALQTQATKAIEHEMSIARQRVVADQRRAESYQVIDDRRANVTLAQERRNDQRLQDEMASRPAPAMAGKRDH